MRDTLHLSFSIDSDFGAGLVLALRSPLGSECPPEIATPEGRNGWDYGITCRQRAYAEGARQSAQCPDMPHPLLYPGTSPLLEPDFRAGWEDAYRQRGGSGS